MPHPAGGPRPYPLHVDSEAILITHGMSPPRPSHSTSGSVADEHQVVGTVPCERLELACRGQFNTHQVGAWVGRTRDGMLYCDICGGDVCVPFTSSDDGCSWTHRPIHDRLAVPVPRLLAVLRDNCFVAASGGGEQPTVFWRSADRGRSWQKLSVLHPHPFSHLHIDGNLLELNDGTLLMPLQWARWGQEQTMLTGAVCAQYMVRSTDGGTTWQNTPDPDFWRALLDNDLTFTGTSPAARIPGPGGTFPGVWETGIEELSDGTVLGAFRYSGPPQPWHASMIEAWHGATQFDEPDSHGRLFRIIMRASSPDGGVSWQDFGPIVDAEGQALLIHGECNGELLQMPDGRVALIHQRRYPRGQEQLMARFSEDGGRTWLPDEYRLQAGFGYPSSVALADGTIITVTGSCKCDTNSVAAEPPGAVVIRWRPRSS